MHEMIRAKHVLACVIVFILLSDQGVHQGALKLMKNDHF